MFAKKPAPQSPRNQQVKTMAGSTFSVFGQDTRIKGDVQAGADLHIDGAVEGDVTCTSLVQGESSTIEGAIRAESARLAGTVKGTITVRELRLSAGAGFLVALTGEIVTMPGLPAKPAAWNIGLTESGRIRGLMQNDS